MNLLRRLLINKKGSYIVEAAVIMPIFVIAFLMLSSLIPISAVCENIMFSAADEMRLEAVESAVKESSIRYPGKLAIRVRRENPRICSFKLVRFRKKYSEHGIDDLMQVKFRAVFVEKNPFNLYGRVRFKGTVTGRAFTGRYHDDIYNGEGMEWVYIFPKEGRKYHREGCTYVKASCKSTILTPALKKKYKPCPNCGAKKARIGSIVYIFERYGEAYHLPGCESVERHYIRVRKKDAERYGYTPCSKCYG